MKTEDQEQAELVAWLEEKRLAHYAVPNGGYRKPSEAAKFKRTGVKAGVPDLCIPIPTKSFHGLYIELKKEYGGVISDKQQKWIRYLNARGYLAIVCYGANHAKKTICHYLGLVETFDK